jgi:cytidylate kinase
MSIDLKEDGRVICNGEDVSRVIREPLVSGNVSYIAAMKPIRLALVDMQRAMAHPKKRRDGWPGYRNLRSSECPSENLSDRFG